VGREQPADLGMEFDDLFNHEVDDKAEEMSRDTSMTNSEARRFLGQTFQVRRGLNDPLPTTSECYLTFVG